MVRFTESSDDLKDGGMIIIFILQVGKVRSGRPLEQSLSLRLDLARSLPCRASVTPRRTPGRGLPSFGR